MYTFERFGKWKQKKLLRRWIQIALKTPQTNPKKTHILKCSEWEKSTICLLTQTGWKSPKSHLYVQDHKSALRQQTRHCLDFACHCTRQEFV